MEGEIHTWPLLKQLTVGTPVRFMSPYTNNIIIGEVMMWAGFKAVKEIIPEEVNITATGLRWTIPEQTRYIRLTQLVRIEKMPANEYFLHKLKNG